MPTALGAQPRGAGGAPAAHSTGLCCCTSAQSVFLGGMSGRQGDTAQRRALPCLLQEHGEVAAGAPWGWGQQHPEPCSPLTCGGAAGTGPG